MVSSTKAISASCITNMVTLSAYGCGAHFVPDLDSCHLPVEEIEEGLQAEPVQDHAHSAPLTYTALHGYGAIRLTINLNKGSGTFVHVHNFVYERVTDPISL